MLDKDLQEESQELWDNLDNPEFVNNFISKEDEDVIILEKKGRKSASNKELIRVLGELNQLKYSSELIIKDSEKKVSYYTGTEQYFKANEAKVAKFIHENFVRSIERILKGLPTFETIGEIVDRAQTDDRIFIE